MRDFKESPFSCGNKGASILNSFNLWFLLQVCWGNSCQIHVKYKNITFF